MKKTADPFYLAKDWRRLRGLALKRDGYRCIICRHDVSGIGQARVDHILPRKTHPHLALDLGNLRTLCLTCDAQSHREKPKGGGQRDERFIVRGCDANGWPADPNHPWRRGVG